MKNAPNKAAESCSDPSRASNECILAEPHSRESCEKSFSRGDRVASSPGTGAEVLRAQIDVRESSFGGCCPRLHRFQDAVSNILERWQISRRASIHARIFLRWVGHGGCGEFTHVLFCIPFNGISVSSGKHFLYLMTPASLHHTSHLHSFPALSNGGRILLPSKQISLPPSFLYCPVSINSPTSTFSDLRHLSGLLSLYL